MPTHLRLLSLLFAVWFVRLHCHGSDIIGSPEVSAISPTAVTVRWRTDVPTGSRVYFGREADQLATRADGELSDEHEVTIQNLLPGTQYFFAVATAKKRLATGTFTTSSSRATSPPSPSTSPAVKGTTVPHSSPGSSDPSPASNAPVEGRSGFGISSLFGRRTASALPQAPPARLTWAHPDTLPDHFARHGADFGARDQEEYARMAWELRQRAKGNRLPQKVDDAGVLRIFDPKTGAFGAYNPDGTTKTFFKPGKPGYFDRQPGRLVSY